MATNRTQPARKVHDPRAASLQVGYVVALTLREGDAPLRCYVGQVEAIDVRGVRLTLIDWLVGMFVGYDLFVPWGSITSALVATPEHDMEGFRDEASQWQNNCK